ncbi:MAG: hypothetical protein ACD_48C00679G0001 [uncultured bacterium]|nr:MAG: hypothetical protein ACD_48C00679G0001 [uncultured bacterium]
MQSYIRLSKQIFLYLPLNHEMIIICMYRVLFPIKGPILLSIRLTKMDILSLLWGLAVKKITSLNEQKGTLHLPDQQPLIASFSSFTNIVVRLYLQATRILE